MKFVITLPPYEVLAKTGDEGLNPTTREPVAEVANDGSRAASSFGSMMELHDLRPEVGHRQCWDF
jgi:hypothetical protein